MIAVYAPDCGKDLDADETFILHVTKMLGEGRRAGAKEFFITGDLNVEMGILCTGEDDIGELDEIYGPVCWQGCENDHGGFKKLMWHGMMKEFNYRVTSTWLRSASAMALSRCMVSRYATAWAESLEGAMALLCRNCCRLLLAEIPKGVDRNSEVKQRLHLWEAGQISDLICKVLGQQNSGPLRSTARRVQTQTDGQRGKRA